MIPLGPLAVVLMFVTLEFARAKPKRAKAPSSERNRRPTQAPAQSSSPPSLDPPKKQAKLAPSPQAKKPSARIAPPRPAPKPAPTPSGPETHEGAGRVLTVIPVKARRSSGYGWRIHPISGKRKFHKGLDMAASSGTPVYAAGPGVVSFAGWGGGYGNLIKIDHGKGLETRYGHLSRIKVSQGQHVKAGHLIGLVGTTGHSTGPHLHFEVRKNGEATNPKDLIPEI